MRAHSFLEKSILIVLFLLILGGLYAVRPGETFPHFGSQVTVIRITEGQTLMDAATTLKTEHVIRFRLPAAVLLKLFGGERGLKAGAYVIQPTTLPIIALWQMAHGSFGVDPIKVTIPEGATSYEIAEILKNKFIDFDEQKFASLAKEQEGFLFPDTYFFLPTATEGEIIVAMQENFKRHIDSVSVQLSSSGKSLRELVIIASLLEKEARTTESREAIAGIIDNRLKINMPLQIDAVFGYIKETNTFSPTLTDLATDSPYNLYRNKGLPPGPIANPGLASLLAAASSTKSNYLYYLTGHDGKMYYAKTFDQHVANRRAYLY